MNKLLWIDDLRKPSDFIDVDGYTLCWTQTYDSSHDAITVFEPNIIHLDNDLSDEQDRQGRHLFNYIEYLLHEGHLRDLQEVRIHSDNSSAVSSMMLAKDNFQDQYGVKVSQVIYKS